MHYKLDRKAFIDTFFGFLRNKTENIENENPKTSDSLTEPTAYLSSELTKKYKGVNSEEVHTSAISFKEYCKRCPVKESEEAEVIKYFLNAYKKSIGVEHPRLKPEQWRSVVDSILFDDFSLDALEAMIDKYFETNFQEGCNYSILHFNNDGVKMRRMYEVAY